MAEYKEKRTPRSLKYQHLLVETVFPNEMLESFSNEDSVYKRLNPFDYNDKICELQEVLREEFWRIVNTMLTERQKQVITLSCSGKTQCEIGEILNINQSSITKSINGNTSYSTNSKSYGGSLRKIHKIIESDPKIMKVIQEISDLRNETWL